MTLDDLKKHPDCYYYSDRGVLLCGNCLDIMPSLDMVGLVLTDPPYGIKIWGTQGIAGWKGLANPKKYDECVWDKKRPPKEIFDLMLSKSKNQIIFGGNYFLDYLRPTPCFLVWDKENGASSFADCELAWTSFSSASRIIKYRWHGFLKKILKKTSSNAKTRGIICLDPL